MLENSQNSLFCELVAQAFLPRNGENVHLIWVTELGVAKWLASYKGSTKCKCMKFSSYSFSLNFTD